MIGNIYRGVVQLDISNDGETRIGELNILKFIDLWIYTPAVRKKTNSTGQLERLVCFLRYSLLKSQNRFPILKLVQKVPVRN